MELKADLITVDMVDIILEVNSYIFDREIKPILDSRKFDMRLEYKVNYDWNRYRHNFYYKNHEQTYSFYFAYQSNLPGLENRFYLSYNPNKVDPDDDMLEILMTFILGNIRTAKISKFDIAFDYVGIRTSDLIIDKSSYREHKTFRYADSDPTEYLGKGFIKIYDKAAEEVKEDPTLKKGNKTRLEYTVRDKIHFLEYEAYECTTTMGKFNLKGVLGLYDDKELTDFDKLLIYSVENGYPIDKLSYRNKRKYQEIASNKKEMYTEIKPSQSHIEKAIKKYLTDLFDEYNYTTKRVTEQFKYFIEEGRMVGV